MFFRGGNAFGRSVRPCSAASPADAFLQGTPASAVAVELDEHRRPQQVRSSRSLELRVKTRTRIRIPNRIGMRPCAKPNWWNIGMIGEELEGRRLSTRKTVTNLPLGVSPFSTKMLSFRPRGIRCRATTHRFGCHCVTRMRRNTTGNACVTNAAFLPVPPRTWMAWGRWEECACAQGIGRLRLLGAILRPRLCWLSAGKRSHPFPRRRSRRRLDGNRPGLRLQPRRPTTVIP